MKNISMLSEIYNMVNENIEPVADKLSDIYDILDLIQDKVDTETLEQVRELIIKGNEIAFTQGFSICFMLSKETTNNIIDLQKD